jgi:hypothetical protein
MEHSRHESTICAIFGTAAAAWCVLEDINWFYSLCRNIPENSQSRSSTNTHHDRVRRFAEEQIDGSMSFGNSGVPHKPLDDFANSRALKYIISPNKDD